MYQLPLDSSYYVAARSTVVHTQLLECLKRRLGRDDVTQHFRTPVSEEYIPVEVLSFA